VLPHPQQLFDTARDHDPRKLRDVFGGKIAELHSSLEISEKPVTHSCFRRLISTHQESLSC
jgi:hypothetical protein